MNFNEKIYSNFEKQSTDENKKIKEQYEDPRDNSQI
jgi:hypothetical protein